MSESEEQSKPRPGVFRRIGVILLVCLLVLLSISLVVQIPGVQRWGVNRITTYLSKETGSAVSVGGFTLNVFSQFTLRDVYISQYQTPADTLIYAGEIGLRFSRIWKLFGATPEIKQLRLNSARLYITDIPIEIFASRERKKSARGISIHNPRIQVHDVQVRIDKSAEPVLMNFSLPDGEFLVDHMDTESKELQVSAISLSRPSALLLKRTLEITGVDTTIIKPAADTLGRKPLQWRFGIDKVLIEDGAFTFLEGQPLDAGGQVDYHNLKISKLELEVDGVMFADDILTGRIIDFGFNEQSGFHLDRIASEHFKVSPEGIALGNVRILTDDSAIADTLYLGLAGRDTLSGEIEPMRIYARLKDAHIAVSDLIRTIPGLDESPVFQKNANEVIHISGIVSGPLNRLRGDSLNILLGDMTFTGKFRSRNLLNPGQQLINLEIGQARFRAQDLEKHIPGIRVQEQYDRLGLIQFQGRFDGFLNDFVAYGKVRTDIGSAEVDLNLETGKARTTYSGALNLIEFDLGKWTGLPQFGLVSANLNLKNGSGLTAETAAADIDGTIRQFQYQGYTYSDVVVDGRIEQNRFNGRMDIEDEHIRMLFEGAVDVVEGKPEYDFIANVDHLDLKSLNLSKDTFSVSGIISAQGSGKSFRELVGRVRAANVVVDRGVGQHYALDTMFVDIEMSPDSQRLVRVTSDYLDGWVRGDYEVQSLYPSIARYLEETYPQYFDSLRYKPELAEHKPSIEFELQLNKPEEWGGLVGLRNVRFHDLDLAGILKLEQDSVIINISAPDVHVGNVNIYRPRASIRSIAGKASAETEITAVDISERYFFDEIGASMHTDSNGFVWRLAADDLLEELNTLDLTGRFRIDSQGAYSLFLDPKVLEVLSQSWELKEGNRISWGKDFLDLRDIVFENGDQSITIEDVNRKGVFIETQRFDFSIIDVLWDYDPLDFSGPYTLRLSVDDVFHMDGFRLSLDAPELFVNDDSYGKFSVSAVMAHAGEPVQVGLSMERPQGHLNATAQYYPPMKQVSEELQNTFDAKIRLDTFPVHFIEYWLADAVDSMTGYFLGDLAINGSTSQPKMLGDVTLHDVGVTVTYLGTRYFVDNQPAHITETRIDATGAFLSDTYGNLARVTGGLSHRMFSKWGINARIQSDRIAVLQTTSRDNELYYGTGIGTVDVLFTGMLDRPTVSVDATTQAGTNVIINLTEETTTKGSTFIKFRSDKEVLGSALQTRTNITGMNFDMNLNATPDATIQILLENDPPESIVGTGSGNIRMAMTRTGDFSMYGEYEIEEGDYLFKSFVIINKPFKLRRGGTIRWSGDPYDAVIDIEADYSGLRAAVYTLIAEYLVNASPQTQEEARRKTDVQLKLLLTGTLLEPEINFDLSFPNISGELAGYVETKLRVLKANQSALNEQVFGLLWAGAFLPSNVLQSSSGLALAGEGISNSISEFLSGQVSALFSNVISRWVEDVDFISGIDFDVGYSKVSQFDLPGTTGGAGYEEWEVRVKNRLLNDRIIIDAGANYGTRTEITSEAYLVGDYALEYLLTRDGRLKVRFYYRNDQTIEGRKDKYGIGLAWRREFDTFDEWLKGLKKEAKSLRDEGPSDKGLN